MLTMRFGDDMENFWCRIHKIRTSAAMQVDVNESREYTRRLHQYAGSPKDKAGCVRQCACS